MSDVEPALRIAVVGPCAAGKSTLVKKLRHAGYYVRQPAQEHSYVPNMWQRLSHPDVLIYLDVDYVASKQRRPHIDYGPERLHAQHKRLAHARQHCHLYLDTSQLSDQEVHARVLEFLRQANIRPGVSKESEQEVLI